MVTLKKLIIVLSATACICVGCKREDGKWFGGGDETLSFATSVPNDELNALDTKGALSLKDENGKVVLSLSYEESKMPEQLSRSGSTKSTLIDDSDSFKENYGGFWVSAFDNNVKYLDIDKTEVEKPAEGQTLWTFKDGVSRRWVNGKNLEFFAWAPASTTFSGGQAWTSDPTFTPASGSGATATISSYTIANPETQADLLISHYYGKPSSSITSGNVAELTFSHPLTAIKFKAGEKLEDLTINSIKITGIAKSGTCISTFGTTTTHQWSDITTGDWEKVFDTPIAPEDLENSLETLLTIPQTFQEGAKIVLNITSAGTTYNVSYDLCSDAGAVTWESGKITTYTLNYPGTPALSVDDEVVGNVKQNLKIVNTGDCKAWFRATIVGYWCTVGTNDNTSPWTGNGYYKNLAPSSSKWKLGDDGFYYYTDPVEPLDPLDPVTHSGEIPTPLFESFTAPTAPADDLYLKMFIVSQSVKYDADKALVRKAWGDNTPITK